MNHEINKLNGIVVANTSHENGNTVVEFDGTKTNKTAIKKAIRLTGYEVTEKIEIE